MNRVLQWAVLVGAILLVTSALPAVAADKKPNILVIWGDDIGSFNLDRVMEAMTKPQGGGN
jgi:hypothetical protein